MLKPIPATFGRKEGRDGMEGVRLDRPGTLKYGYMVPNGGYLGYTEVRWRVEVCDLS